MSEHDESAHPVSVRQSSPHLAPEDEERTADEGFAVGPARRFSLGGEEWIARRVGEGAVGTAGSPQAYLAAIRFFRAEDPGTPVREAIIARGRFEQLFDEELQALLGEARPLEAR